MAEAIDACLLRPFCHQGGRPLFEEGLILAWSDYVLGRTPGLGAQPSPGTYFIEAEGAGVVKIGHGDARRRLHGFQVGNHLPLRLVAVADPSLHSERALHESFSGDLVRGEWFRLSPALAGFLFGETPGLYRAAGWMRARADWSSRGGR